jgi:DNA-binding protein H-NS
MDSGPIMIWEIFEPLRFDARQTPRFGEICCQIYNFAGKARRWTYSLLRIVMVKGGMNKKPNFDGMSVDELWQLHEELSQVLSVRLTSEKRELEKRLAQLRREKEMRQSETADARSAPRERRKYPRVFPKYRNPEEPSETWSGRGKQPRWLTAALKTGHKIEEFVISKPNASSEGSRRRRA